MPAKKLRRFSVECTKLNRKGIDEIVDPKKMVGHGVGGS
jgi:hypothetical protein